MVGHGGFWKLDRGSGITGVPSGGPGRSNNEDRVGRRPGHLLVKEEVIKGKRSLLGGGDCKEVTLLKLELGSRETWGWQH